MTIKKAYIGRLLLAAAVCVAVVHQFVAKEGIKKEHVSRISAPALTKVNIYNPAHAGTVGHALPVTFESVKSSDRALDTTKYWPEVGDSLIAYGPTSANKSGVTCITEFSRWTGVAPHTDYEFTQVVDLPELGPVLHLKQKMHATATNTQAWVGVAAPALQLEAQFFSDDQWHQIKIPRIGSKGELLGEYKVTFCLYHWNSLSYQLGRMSKFAMACNAGGFNQDASGSPFSNTFSAFGSAVLGCGVGSVVAMEEESDEEEEEEQQMLGIVAAQKRAKKITKTLNRIDKSLSFQLGDKDDVKGSYKWMQERRQDLEEATIKANETKQQIQELQGQYDTLSDLTEKERALKNLSNKRKEFLDQRKLQLSMVGSLQNAEDVFIGKTLFEQVKGLNDINRLADRMPIECSKPIKETVTKIRGLEQDLINDVSKFHQHYKNLAQTSMNLTTLKYKGDEDVNVFITKIQRDSFADLNQAIKGDALFEQDIQNKLEHALARERDATPKPIEEQVSSPQDPKQTSNVHPDYNRYAKQAADRQLLRNFHKAKEEILGNNNPNKLDELDALKSAIATAKMEADDFHLKEFDTLMDEIGLLERNVERNQKIKRTAQITAAVIGIVILTATAAAVLTRGMPTPYANIAYKIEYQENEQPESQVRAVRSEL